MKVQRLNSAQQRTQDFFDLVAKLTALETLASKVGLWRTYHAINKAKREAGYERALQVDPEGWRVHERARKLLERGR